MKLWFRVVLGSSLVLVMTFFVIGTHVSALMAPTGLTIAPVRTLFDITPGAAQTGRLTVYNMTKSDMDVSMNAEVFNVINQNYDYSFSPTSTVAGWIHFDPSTIVLAAGKSKTINYSVNVPVGAEPGGKYISMFATTSIKSSGTEASSSERVGSLLYITVSGDVSRTGYVLGLFIPWSMTSSTVWSATLRDSGSAHFTSNYSMDVKTLWNSDVSSYSSTSLILPMTIRLVTGTIAAPTIPGIYKLVFTASLGDSKGAKITKYILYMPIYGWIIIVTILLIITSIVRATHRRHEKNRKN